MMICYFIYCNYIYIEKKMSVNMDVVSLIYNTSSIYTYHSYSLSLSISFYFDSTYINSDPQHKWNSVLRFSTFDFSLCQHWYIYNYHDREHCEFKIHLISNWHITITSIHYFTYVVDQNLYRYCQNKMILTGLKSNCGMYI
jgi:hypothetical protein